MQNGMTLIEILVVIAIIGIVATVVAVGVMGYKADTDKSATVTLVNNVSKGVTAYAVSHRELPPTLGVLVGKRYIKRRQTVDPWGSDLRYELGIATTMDDYTVCSAGPDLAMGNADDICANQEAVAY